MEVSVYEGFWPDSGAGAPGYGALPSAGVPQRLGYVAEAAFQKEGVPPPEETLEHLLEAERVAVLRDDDGIEKGFAGAFRTGSEPEVVVQNSLAVLPECRGRHTEELTVAAAREFAGEGTIFFARTQHPWVIDYYQRRGGYPRRDDEPPERLLEGVKPALDWYGDEMEDGMIVREGYDSALYPEGRLQRFASRIESMTGKDEGELDFQEGDYVVTAFEMESPEDLFQDIELMADGGREPWEGLRELGIEPMSPLGHEQSLETIKSEILEYEQPRVLDYGAGEGRLIRHLENDSPWAELKGIDRAEFSGSHGEVITGAGLERIEDLGEKDVVAAVNVLQEIEDPELAVQRFRESLAEDGKIVATYPGPMAKPRFEEGILRVDFQDLERLFSDEFKRQPWIGELEPFEQEYIGREQVDRMFQKMDSRESTLPVDVPERTREVLEFLGYEIPPEPEVDYVVAREC